MKFLSKLAELFKDKEPVAVEAPKPVELKKRTKKLVSKKEMVDLGVTSVLLKFQDGRELITRVYGSYSESVDYGSDEHKEGIKNNYDFKSGKYTSEVVEPSVILVYKKDSATLAEQFIKSLKGDVSTTQVDCPRKPTVSFVGKVISAQIIKTEQCLEEVTKYSVEPI